MRNVVNALGGNLGEVSANWNQEDVSLKSLGIFLLVFVCVNILVHFVLQNILESSITHRNPYVWCI